MKLLKSLNLIKKKIKKEYHFKCIDNFFTSLSLKFSEFSYFVKSLLSNSYYYDDILCELLFKIELYVVVINSLSSSEFTVSRSP